MYETDLGVVFEYKDDILLKPRYFSILTKPKHWKYIHKVGKIIKLKKTYKIFLKKFSHSSDIFWVMKYYNPSAVIYWNFFRTEILTFDYPFKNYEKILRYKTLSVEVIKRKKETLFKYGPKDSILLVFIIDRYISILTENDIAYNLVIDEKKINLKEGLYGMVDLHNEIISSKEIKIEYDNQDFLNNYVVMVVLNNEEIIEYL